MCLQRCQTDPCHGSHHSSNRGFLRQEEKVTGVDIRCICTKIVRNRAALVTAIFVWMVMTVSSQGSQRQIRTCVYEEASKVYLRQDFIHSYDLTKFYIHMNFKPLSPATHFSFWEPGCTSKCFTNTHTYAYLQSALNWAFTKLNSI